MSPFLVVASVLVFAVLLQQVVKRIRGEAPYLLEPIGPYAIHLADESIIVEDSVGEHHMVDWSEVRAVLIRTTDKGPFEADVFWELQTEDRPVTFPNDADGVGRFLESAPAHLSGFDHEAVIRAMASTENAAFTVWKRG